MSLLLKGRIFSYISAISQSASHRNASCESSESGNLSVCMEPNPRNKEYHQYKKLGRGRSGSSFLFLNFLLTNRETVQSLGYFNKPTYKTTDTTSCFQDCFTLQSSWTCHLLVSDEGFLFAYIAVAVFKKNFLEILEIDVGKGITKVIELKRTFGWF